MRAVEEFILFLLFAIRTLLGFLVVLTNYPLETVAVCALLAGFVLVLVYVVRGGRNQKDRG